MNECMHVLCMYVLLSAYNNNYVFKILRRNSRAYITKQVVRQCLCGGSYCVAAIYPVSVAQLYFV